MKVDFNRTALTEALGLLTSVIPSRTPKPILRCVQITAGEKDVRICATDLEVGINYLVSEVTVSQTGEVVIPADRRGIRRGGRLGRCLCRRCGDGRRLRLLLLRFLGLRFRDPGRSSRCAVRLRGLRRTMRVSLALRLVLVVVRRQLRRVLVGLGR